MDQQNEEKIENGIAGKRKINKEANSKDMKKHSKSKSLRRRLPAELVDELFACLPLENAFGVLLKMSNDLLAKNVRKMFNSIKMAMKSNKWNAADCGPNLTISEEGLVVKHFRQFGRNCVRTKLAIPKLNSNAKSMIAYFEVELVEKNLIKNCSIGIGFCDGQLPLEGSKLGYANNSIGICWKCGTMLIEGDNYNLKNDIEAIQVGVVIGIGIINSSPMMKCFASCNGKLLGMVELPKKFATLQLFSAVLLQGGDSIRANFGQNEWRFNPNQIH